MYGNINKVSLWVFFKALNQIKMKYESILLEKKPNSARIEPVIT